MHQVRATSCSSAAARRRLRAGGAGSTHVLLEVTVPSRLATQLSTGAWDTGMRNDYVRCRRWVAKLAQLLH